MTNVCFRLLRTLYKLPPRYSKHQRYIYQQNSPTQANFTTMKIETTNITWPPGLSSYQPAIQTPTEKSKSLYIVLQHSKAAGTSRMLPYSNIAGVFQTRADAQQYLHILKDKRQPLVKAEGGDDAAAASFWCTGDGTDEDENGFWYKSQSGEESRVWIEEHEIQETEAIGRWRWSEAGGLRRIIGRPLA